MTCQKQSLFFFSTKKGEEQSLLFILRLLRIKGNFQTDYFQQNYNLPNWKASAMGKLIMHLQCSANAAFCNLQRENGNIILQGVICKPFDRNKGECDEFRAVTYAYLLSKGTDFLLF